MVALTFTVLMALGLARFRAIKNREISINYYKMYADGIQPDKLHILTRHLQNHFEVPPLFYLAIIFIFLTESVNTLTVFFAWLFVICRYLHTFIHLGGNNISHRFYCFCLSVFALMLLWSTIGYSLIEGAK